jgi:mRNA interferase YafQ
MTSKSNLQPQLSRQFRKDLKKAKKQGRNLQALKEVLLKLSKGEKLLEKSGYRDCHIGPDWLLQTSHH